MGWGMVHDGIHYDTLPEEGHDPLIHTVNNTVSEEIGKIIKKSTVIELDHCKFVQGSLACLFQPPSSATGVTIASFKLILW